MIIFLFIMGGLVAYLIVGAIAARIARPSILARATFRKGDQYQRFVKGYNSYYETVTCESDGIDRGEIAWRTWLMLLGWPVYSWAYAVNASLHAAADRVDPEVHAEQAQRIRELEHELLDAEGGR